MRRRQTLALGAALALPMPGLATPEAAAAAGKKVLHIAFPVAETGFDPPQLSDLYSRTVTPHIFEALYRYDHLARPVKVRPLTAEAMPEVSADYRSFTVKVRRGIFFQDDPAFKSAPWRRRK